MERGWCSLGTALVQPRYTPILPINRISKFSIALPPRAAKNHAERNTAGRYGRAGKYCQHYPERKSRKTKVTNKKDDTVVPLRAAENHVTQEWKTQRNCNTEPAGAAKNHAKTIFEYKKIKKVYFLLSLL